MTTVSKVLTTLAIVALPFAGTALAGQASPGTMQQAQSGSGQMPEECAKLTDAQERLECLREQGKNQ